MNWEDGLKDQMSRWSHDEGEPYNQSDSKDYRTKLDDFSDDFSLVHSVLRVNFANKASKERQCIVHCHLFAMDSNREENTANVVVSVQKTIETHEYEANYQRIVLEVSMIDENEVWLQDQWKQNHVDVLLWKSILRIDRLLGKQV